MKIKTSELTGAALDWAVAKCEALDTRNNYCCQVTVESDDNNMVEYAFYCMAEGHEHAEEQALDAYPGADVGLIEHLGIYTPSTDWSQGGPIIEREEIEIKVLADGIVIELHPTFKDGDRWEANIWPDNADIIEYCGPTPLIAAMRCFVSSKLGDEVNVPKELI